MRNPRENNKWMDRWQHTEGETNPGLKMGQGWERNDRFVEVWRMNESQPKKKVKGFQVNVKTRKAERTCSVWRSERNSAQHNLSLEHFMALGYLGTEGRCRSPKKQNGESWVGHISRNQVAMT